MNIPLFILLTLATVIYADASIGLPDLTRCGKERYMECHVEAACLYGERKRETPMYLRRYLEEFHGERDISKCKTVIVVSATPPLKKPKSDSYLHMVHVEHEVRSFEAKGWIDPAHFSIGVRFIVGQKLVMLSEDDGFTDDDDWVYGKGQLADLGQFPVFNGTFNQTTQDGKIRISLKAQAYDSYRRSHYVIPYRPRQPLSPFVNGEVEEKEQQASTNAPTSTVAAATAVQPQEQQASTTANGTAVQPQEQQASSKTSSNEYAAEPSTAGVPIFTIVMCVAGALIASFGLGLVGYAWVKRNKRKAAKQKTESAPETETLIVDPGAEEKTATAAQQ